MCSLVFFDFVVISVIAQNSASSGDVRGARRLGKVSLALSICGLVIGAILLIAYITGAAQRAG